MSATIYVIRHGQTEGNKDNKYIGHTDIGITELGQKQAEITARYLYETVKFDAIYSSDLKRAYLTALPTAKLQGLEITKSNRLRELCGGVWERMYFPDIIEKYPEEYELWKTDFASVHPVGGESVAELSERVYAEIKRIARENDGKVVAVFTHGAVIRALVCRLSGKPLSEIKDIPWSANTSITIAEISESKDRLLTIQSAEHLGEELVTKWKD